MIDKIAIIASLIAVCLSAYSMQDVDDPQAVCIDGSPGKFYYHEGDPQKIFIHFQRGGGCIAGNQNLAFDQCVRRRSNNFGSSNYFRSDFDFQTGIMSTFNDRSSFKGWTKAFFPYCDGAIHQGYAAAPYIHNGQEIYIRGERITRARIAKLNSLTGLFTNATQIVVSGTSAGGIAVLNWLNYFKDNAPSTAKVYGVVDSGITKDRAAINNVNIGRLVINVLMGFANVGVNPPNTRCVDANPTQKWKCFFGQYMHNHMNAPIFMISSQYDNWFLPNIMAVRCISENGSISGCSTAQRNFMEDLRLNTIEIAKTYNSVPGNAVWSVACTGHGFMNSTIKFGPDAIYNVPKNSINDGISILTKWMDGNYDSSNPPIDDVSWPYNINCAFGFRLILGFIVILFGALI